MLKDPNRSRFSYQSVSALITATVLAVLPQSPAPADEKSGNKQWQDQEAWSQFTDKEHYGGFKTSHTQPKHVTSVLEVIQGGGNKNASSSGSNYGDFKIPAYVVMPTPEAAPVPTSHIETNVIPVVRPNSDPIGFPSIGYSGWGYNGLGYSHHGWGGGWAGGYGGWHGGWHGGWGGPVGLGFGPGGLGLGFGPGGLGLGGGPVVGFRKETRVVQDGPSKSSGNYYNPSTPDPSASGNYYASPTAAPKAMPIIHQDAPPSDYWGKSGNPFPTDGQ